MSYSISETAKLSGVSIRTLHYYDEIGLLTPEGVSEAGYRYYGEPELCRLQQILFYRELNFPLKEIVRIMSAQGDDQKTALVNQRELLKMKRDRLDKLIELIGENLKGEQTMSFKEFDMTDIENARKNYAEEVREKWGDTGSFVQSEKKTGGYKKSDWERITARSNEMFDAFSKLRGTDPASRETQNLVGQWREFISQTYYDCTMEILEGLGKMYTADERFMKNIDKFGAGTADFMSRAIAHYCAK